jgi:hypothetical protein
MPYTQVSALTSDQWETRDYRQSARVVDDWAKSQSGAHEEDATEYVAKLGESARLGHRNEPGPRSCPDSATSPGSLGGICSRRATVWLHARGDHA